MFCALRCAPTWCWDVYNITFSTSQQPSNPSTFNPTGKQQKQSSDLDNATVITICMSNAALKCYKPENGGQHMYWPNSTCERTHVPHNFLVFVIPPGLLYSYTHSRTGRDTLPTLFTKSPRRRRRGPPFCQWTYHKAVFMSQRAMQIVQRTALRVIIHNLQRSFVLIAPCILLSEREAKKTPLLFLS